MNKDSIDTNSVAHTTWNCKYYIVFAPKYRRKVFYEEKNRNKRNITPIMPMESLQFGDVVQG